MLPVQNRWKYPATAAWVAGRAGAHRSWFHLYRMLMLPPPAPDAAPAGCSDGPHAQLDDQQKQRQQRAVALEQFMQSSPLGEYRRRLDLLWVFRWAPLPFSHLVLLTQM